MAKQRGNKKVKINIIERNFRGDGISCEIKKNERKTITKKNHPKNVEKLKNTCSRKKKVKKKCFRVLPFVFMVPNLYIYKFEKTQIALPMIKIFDPRKSSLKLP